MDVALIIPARYQSSRFPGKPLVPILGIPLVIRVANISAKAVGREHVYVATDDSRIKDECKKHGYQVVITSDTCLTGTDRVAEAAEQISADIFVNVQGDEPMLDPSDICNVIDTKQKTTSVITCMSKLTPRENPTNPKIPKVVFGEGNNLLYASRAAIPGSKDGATHNTMKQVCIYAFEKWHLRRFSERKAKTPLEAYEDLEILRFLEIGIPVQLVEVGISTHAVDVPADVDIVEELLQRRTL